MKIFIILRSSTIYLNAYLSFLRWMAKMRNKMSSEICISVVCLIKGFYMMTHDDSASSYNFLFLLPGNHNLEAGITRDQKNLEIIIVL